MKLTDFTLPYKEGFKILHITDTQLIDSTQQRSPDRLKKEEYETWLPSNFEVNCFNQIDFLVKETQPDLILVDGDIIYGEFDDNGSCLKAILSKLSSYGIPYSITYGNHDNESVLGRKWQSNQIASAPNCMFKDDVCSIGLVDESDNIKRIILMVDSNGCGHASELSLKDNVDVIPRLTNKQLETLNSLKTSLEEKTGAIPPMTVLEHIIPLDVFNKMAEKGYFPDPFVPYETPKEGEFGVLYEKPWPACMEQIEILKKLNCDTLFLGHDHLNSLSTSVDGITVTFILKTGTYDYHKKELQGGTLSVISEDGKKIESKHIYYMDK